MAGDDTRVSDRERQAVVDQLSGACGEGLLTLEEFSDRAGDAYAAITRDDLDHVLRDLRLPATVESRLAPGGPAAVAPDPSRRHRWIVTLFGSDHRHGRWRAEPKLRALAVMGSAHVDLRDALIEGLDIEIHAGALLGSVHVIVPAGIPVDVRGFAVFGSRRNDVAPSITVIGGPRVLVRGYGLFGTVKVESEPLDDGRTS